MALAPGTRLGVYHVTAPHGAGGMGEVYRATDSSLKREVALKVLPSDVARDPDRLARFHREAELLASLNHPNVAQVYGLQSQGDTSVLVMELVEGEDLARRIARRSLEMTDALRIACQIAAGLEAAHERGIVHRDLKPANVMVRPDGRVKVLDFGLAKSVAPGGTDTATAMGLTVPGAVVGTPAYMSPEQARGEPAGREADVWAFGVVLYELLTGTSPFMAATMAETLALVLSAPVDERRLASVPASVRRLLRRCLEREPSRRWRDLGDARIQLEDALATPADMPPVVSPPGASSVPRVTRRHVLAGGAASAALLAVGALAGAALGRARPSPSAPSFRRLTFRHGLVRSARFAPDGQTILYGALWDNDRCRVHTVRIDGPESRALDLPEANLLAVSRSGELALSLGPHEDGVITYGTLARVPMAGGAPRELLEHVKFADWSPDGADLAIVRRVDGGDQLEYPMGHVLVRPDAEHGTGLGFARVSADGRRVAFVQYTNPFALEGRVAVVDASGTVTPMSGTSLNIHGLAWRGDDIVYTAADDRPLYRAVHAVRPGGDTRLIARAPSNITVWDALPTGRLVTAQTDDRAVLMAHLAGDEAERDLSWLDASRFEDLSRDGRRVLFTEYGQGGGPGNSVYFRDVDGAAVRLGHGRGLALSPDGQWAVRVTTQTGPAEALDLLPTGPGEAQRIEGRGLRFLSARWLPDGKRLIVAAAAAGGRPRLLLHSRGTDASTPLTPEGIGGWAIAPDGAAVVAQGADGTARRYDLGGGPPADVPGLTPADQLVGWITAGLLVMRVADASSPLGQIYLVDVGTGARTPWHNILPRDRAGIMTLTAFGVTSDGQSRAYSWHRAFSSLYLGDGLV